MRTLTFILAVLPAMFFGKVVAAPLLPTAPVEFSGDIKANEDLSAIAKLGELLLIGADENKNIIQLLEPDGDNKYKVRENIYLTACSSKTG